MIEDILMTWSRGERLAAALVTVAVVLTVAGLFGSHHPWWAAALGASAVAFAAVSFWAARQIRRRQG
jgi:membrane protein YdbS with pleckstrin-like domain